VVDQWPPPQVEMIRRIDEPYIYGSDGTQGLKISLSRNVEESTDSAEEKLNIQFVENNAA
jgi:hypothetical protein